MKFMRRLALACLFVVSALDVASAGTITFIYSVTGNGNATQDGVILTYSFVPLQPASTPLGPLDVRYMGTIDFSLAPPHGPTTATWDFGALGSFFGSGVEFGDFPPPSGPVPFSGTSVIEGGAGIFAAATGTTSYEGSLDPVTGIAMFTERVVITAPGLPAVPEPASLLLLGTGLAGLRTVRRRRRRD